MATEGSGMDRHLAYSEAIADALSKSRPVDAPKAILLGGQPGAGKSTLAQVAVRELSSQGGSVVIDADRMRERNPDFKRLSIDDPLNAADRTHKEAGQWAVRLTEQAMAGKRNLVVDGTMRDPVSIRDLTERLKRNGYTVEARVMAVHPEVSLARAQLRFEQQVEARGFGRHVNPDQHDVAFKGLSTTVAALERDKRVDAVRVYSANHVVLYQNAQERGEWAKKPEASPALEAERTRPQSYFERKAYIETLQEVVALARQRTGEPAHAIEGKLASARSDLAQFEKSPAHQRAEAFDRLTQTDALAQHPELDASYKQLQQVKQAWTPATTQDERERGYFEAKAALSSQLRAGDVPQGSVSLQESRRVIDLAADHRGVMVRDAREVRQDFKGEVVAASSHHVLLKVSDMVAIAYEKSSLDRRLVPGEKVAIQHANEKSQVHAQDQLPARTLTKDQERDHAFGPRER